MVDFMLIFNMHSRFDKTKFQNFFCDISGHINLKHNFNVNTKLFIHETLSENAIFVLHGVKEC